jgi:hypothetical protein
MAVYAHYLVLQIVVGIVIRDAVDSRNPYIKSIASYWKMEKVVAGVSV